MPDSCFPCTSLLAADRDSLIIETCRYRLTPQETSATDIRFEAASKLAKKIKAEELPTPLTVRDVYRKCWAMLDDKDIVQAACDELVALDWLREYEPVNMTGRPPLTEYFVNPENQGGKPCQVSGSRSFNHRHELRMPHANLKSSSASTPTAKFAAYLRTQARQP